ncbi:lasso peptide biosynthesis PqqD family chaperone [Streptomyces sp. NPDC002643]
MSDAGTNGEGRRGGEVARGVAKRTLVSGARLRRHVSASDVEDGMVLLDERRGRCFKLNRSGALILRALLDGLSPADAARSLAQRYEVSEERAMADVAVLTAELTGKGLVVV